MTRTEAPALLAASALVVIGAFVPGGGDWTGTDNPSCDEIQAATGALACTDDEPTGSDDTVLDLDVPLDLNLRIG